MQTGQTSVTMSPTNSMSLLPAHATKHLSVLQYNSFTLVQTDDGKSNGTALWLGAQVLSAYLSTLSVSPGRAIELGSGIGLSAYFIKI